MPIFAKHVKALSDQDYEKKVDFQWTRALATWLAFLEGSRFDSLVGYHVQERLFQQDREGTLVVIRDACGVRSPNTVLKRGRDLQLFFSWAESNRGQWWPIKELHLLEYVRWTEKKAEVEVDWQESTTWTQIHQVCHGRTVQPRELDDPFDDRLGEQDCFHQSCC